MLFWNSLAFSMIQQIWQFDLWFLCLSKSSLNSWKFMFMYCWTLAWRIFEHYFASMWDEYNCAVVWTFFVIALLWDWNENWPFPILWPLLNFPNLLEKEMVTHSSILAWRIPGTGEPDGLLLSMGLLRVRHNWSNLAAAALRTCYVTLCILCVLSLLIKLNSGHRTGKGQFSFQSQRRAMLKNVQATAQLHLFHMLVS